MTSDKILFSRFELCTQAHTCAGQRKPFFRTQFYCTEFHSYDIAIAFDKDFAIICRSVRLRLRNTWQSEKILIWTHRRTEWEREREKVSSSNNYRQETKIENIHGYVVMWAFFININCNKIQINFKRGTSQNRWRSQKMHWRKNDKIYMRFD